MKISVVIPAFNRAHSLPRALESVARQTRPADEIIVVDDGSEDDTASVMQSWPRVRTIRQENLGVSAARNTGIENTSGDWIALLDSDDEWLSNKLELQTQMIVDNPDYRLCHGNELWIRDGEPLKQLPKHRKQGGWIFDKCLPLCVISPSAALIRKDLLLEHGLFDTSLPACEDYDLWLKICAREPVLYVETPIIKKYGGHDDQLSRKFWGMDRFRITALQNILQRGDLPKPQQKSAAAMLSHKARIFAKGARKHGHPVEAAHFEALARTYDD